jgi:hypothetical protein
MNLSYRAWVNPETRGCSNGHRDLRGEHAMRGCASHGEERTSPWDPHASDIEALTALAQR